MIFALHSQILIQISSHCAKFRKAWVRRRQPAARIQPASQLKFFGPWPLQNFYVKSSAETFELLVNSDIYFFLIQQNPYNCEVTWTLQYSTPLFQTCL